MAMAKSIILEKTIELAKQYAASGSIKAPSEIEKFLDFAFNKITKLNKDT